MVPSGRRWTWSNKQRLVSQLWKKAWCDPEGLDVLGHAVWLFLLIRKPKTILKEQSWCCRYLRRHRDAYTTSPCPFTSTLSHPLKKSGVESRKSLLVKEKCAVGKGCNSEYNPQLCCSVSLYEPFWAAAEVNWSWWKDARWLPQPSVCNVWKGSGLTRPETGALTLRLTKWTEVGYIFKVPSFPAKTVDSAPPNCGFDHGSPFTFHFYGLLGAWAFRSMMESSIQALLFVAPESSPVVETPCMCLLPTPCTADLSTSVIWVGSVSELEGRTLSQKNRYFIKTKGHNVIYISSQIQGKQKSAEI